MSCCKHVTPKNNLISLKIVEIINMLIHKYKIFAQ